MYHLVFIVNHNIKTSPNGASNSNTRHRITPAKIYPLTPSILCDTPSRNRTIKARTADFSSAQYYSPSYRASRFSAQSLEETARRQLSLGDWRSRGLKCLQRTCETADRRGGAGGLITFIDIALDSAPRAAAGKIELCVGRCALASLWVQLTFDDSENRDWGRRIREAIFVVVSPDGFWWLIMIAREILFRECKCARCGKLGFLGFCGWLCGKNFDECTRVGCVWINVVIWFHESYAMLLKSIYYFLIR